jgi:nicotinamide-nucleotide amidase
MKKASIISIGNEVLSGQTVDTNAAYISRKLFSIGIPVVNSYTVGDNIDSIVRALKLASSDTDVVLATGGLGPTADDLTREAFCEFLGVELQLQNELLERIQDFFSRRNLPMPEKTKVQAYIAMPGVPIEMKQMFEESVFAELKRFAPESKQVGMVVRKLKCFGTGESKIAELLGPLMQRDRNPLINCTAQHGVITLHIIAKAKDKDKAQQMVEKDERLLTELLGELIYGRGEQTLAEVVGEKLAQQKKTIAVAESCTGGTLAKLLTDIPGASRCFTYGWVTYSNFAKTSELGVEADLIEKYGSVSDRTAEAMVRGARLKSGADFAIGITGIAGPTGGSEQKPVGLVYISIDSNEGCETKRFIMSGDRDSIRFRAAQTALNMLRLKL